ncbi:type I restriction-modification system subunit M [Clostridium sp. YIM B02515]|uniref:site-specific DNA-methyltransferase (adenine-specific) n=1 Tax=Clostridium rhizosphaerae TaxID=2803861 RepID=A0ABS1TEH9_9CLOT|nr:type I restriction-modification system subunit M [Clostridium rhizosphaerae]MBL4937786.1 type I restriction-modification system subunit M [Clostridium rhizosphaerae]
MAVKKTELYNSLWASCDKLRGGMDATQYKDYILTLLFMKYVTDKYLGDDWADITVFDKSHDPEPDPDKRTGCSFNDIIALKNNKNIGEGIDKIIARFTEPEKNNRLKGVIDNVHFNDETKLGKGQEMIDKLTGIIAIFQRPELNFKNNKATGDDIIGDAYEYLMRHFASESGKSKGQFYTPAEVSRILTKVIEIDKCTKRAAEVYDPACGSGSLLIRALEAAPFDTVSGYGQEKEVTTAGLALMNAVLHNKTTVVIKSGNTFSDPQYKKDGDDTQLKRFDYIVANPPFSLKNWTDGLEEYGRFDGYGDRPPESNGDYAWLMHILKSLRNDGKAAVVLPLGVLFRGKAESTIRKSIVDKGWIKGIIGLPPNLFYGTGISACILVIDKEGAENRGGIFMIDASNGFVKDGNKNRLREQDIYKIVTTFNEQIKTDKKYARFVPNQEIKIKNKYDLNISRYIDSSDVSDLQSIQAHIHGGIPAVDVESLAKYWSAFPTLKDSLLKEHSEGFFALKVDKDHIRQTVYSNEEFAAYGNKVDNAFLRWKNYAEGPLTTVNADTDIKKMIISLAQKLIAEYEPLTLLNKYDVYQVLLAYWNEILNDDVMMIKADERGYGLARDTENIMGTVTSGKNKGDEKIIGWEPVLILKEIVIAALFPEEKKAIEDAQVVAAETESRLAELLENTDENSVLSSISEDGKVKIKDIEAEISTILSHLHTEETDALEKMLAIFPDIKTKKLYTEYIEKQPLCKNAYTDKGTVSAKSINERLAEVRNVSEIPEKYKADYDELTVALDLIKKADEFSKLIKEFEAALDKKCRNRYKTLTDEEIMDLLVNRKWFYTICNGIEELYSAISHRLANRIIELAERYEDTLPELSTKVEDYEAKVKSHLERMGFAW